MKSLPQMCVWTRKSPLNFVSIRIGIRIQEFLKEFLPLWHCGVNCLGGGLRSPSAIIYIMKKALREMQTLRAGCSIKAEAKNFTPPQTPFPGARYGQNLIRWRYSLPSPTDPVWWGSIHAISSCRGNRPTNKQTHPQTDRTDYNTLRRLRADVMIKPGSSAAGWFSRLCGADVD